MSIEDKVGATAGLALLILHTQTELGSPEYRNHPPPQLLDKYMDYLFLLKWAGTAEAHSRALHWLGDYLNGRLTEPGK